MTTYRQVLLTPRVAPLLGAALCSRLAEQMFTLVLVFHVLDVFGSAALAGVVVFAAVAPGLVVSPLAGALLDRTGVVRSIVADLVASAVLVGALAFAPASVTLVLVLAALYSLTSPLNLAGVRVLLPRLVPRHAAERANALDSGLFNLVEVLGPVLAGTVFVLAGGQTALLVVAALYLVACPLVLLLPSDRPSHAVRPPLLRSTFDGVRYVLTHPVLRGLVVSYGLYQVAWGVLVVAVPTVAGDVRAGVLWGAAGIAGLVGALIAGHVLREGRERAAMIAGTAATAAAVLVASAGLIGLAVGLVVVGLVSGLVNVGLLTLRQRRTDPDRLGRVLAVSISLNVLGMPIGSAAGGFLLERSPVLAFATAAVAAVLSAVAVWTLVPRAGGRAPGP
ncbi:MFS transporter [Lentzea flaviverrucosa]|uniref:Predicted arabinose efflux permease, MFS family n=1 Tax=Lentzea flaviverrucosa TaxID=200379 RepID=A0A1H9WCZ5_9PSEU|nr:MFS transporter [Lentzea flaviverrucosa]RDI22190.1 putative MFS family arabinose efflux permease [Lentzea flaviverrucosa]SES31705.1 Predicted arabinose efflux permease, MFS family [Lentzea flaviverrucosa]